MKNFIKKIDWNKVAGLIPVIIQDVLTNEVIMLGYMNREALEKTLESKKVHFYSRTKKRLWMKGETSKNYLFLVDITLDCDADTLLVQVNPIRPTCHTGTDTCFGNTKNALFVLVDLFTRIEDRKKKMPPDSYTASLFTEGETKICEKIEEESLEVIQAVKQETKQRLIEESCDLLYHLFVLLCAKGVRFQDIAKELVKRK